MAPTARLIALIALLATVPLRAAPAFFVSAERGGSVVALDDAGKVVQRIAVGTRPRGLKLSPDGRILYVAVSGSPIGGPGVDESKLPPADHRADGVAVIDVANGKVTRVLPAGSDPETFAVSPDGRTLFVSNEDDGVVSAVRVDGRAARSAPVGDQPEGVAVTPDGARLFVACEGSDHVVTLDARTLRRTGTIAIEGRPRSLLMSADGKTLFVTAESAGKLILVDTADGKVRRSIDLARGDDLLRPMGLVEAANGHVFVTTGRAGAVIEVDPVRGTIVRTVAKAGARPWGIALGAGGRTLVTANGPSDDVTMIDAASGRIVRRVKVDGGPWGVAAPQGR